MLKNTEHVYIDKVVYFSDIEINTLFDTVYVDKYTLYSEFHSHFNFEIQVCIGGEYIIEDGDQNKLSMRPNELCIIPVGYTHSSKVVKENTQRLAFRFYLKQNVPKNKTNGCFAAVNSVLGGYNKPLRFFSRELTDLVKKLHAELYSARESAVLEILIVEFFSGLFAELITDTGEFADKTVSGIDNKNSRAYKIESFMYNNYSDDISKKDLADYLNLSVRQTSRELKALYGVSFREKLISLRMINAAKLLLRTEFSVSTVALKVGYSSNPGFCTSFKKFYGLSPKEYKIKYKEKA